MDCKICVARNCDCLCKTCTRVRDMKSISNEDSENWDFRSKVNLMSRSDYLDYAYKGKV